MNRIGKTIKRRRREAKTDYRARLAILRSGRARVVVRKTNRYIIAQVVVAETAQDKVICGVSSKDLMSHGWPESKQGSLKSLGAAYLTGKLLAKKAKENDVESAILDIGMQRNIKKGRVYAVLKGLVDGGLDVPHNEEALPDDERIEENTAIRELVVKLKGKI